MFNTSQLSWFNSLAASRFGIFGLFVAETGYFKNICKYFAHLIRYHSAGRIRLDSIPTKKYQYHYWSLTNYSVVIILYLMTVSRFPSKSLFSVLWISVTSSAKFALTPPGMAKSSIESFHVIFPGHTLGTATALCIERTAGWSNSSEEKLQHDESAKHAEK